MLDHYEYARRCRDGKGNLCSEYATHAVRAPDHDVHGYVCKRHGAEIVVEYADKLGEQWCLQPLDNESRHLRLTADILREEQ